MQRARRLASAVVAASLAVAGLSACRSQPTVAAYIGDDTTITEQRVQAIWDEAREALAEGQAEGDAEAEQPGGSAEPARMPISRADIVRALVSLDVLKRAAGEQGVQLPADLAYDQVGSQLNLPASTEYVRVYTQVGALQFLMGEKLAKGAEVSEADLRDIYDRLARNGGLEPGMDFETFRTGVPAQAMDQLKTAVALRGALEKVAQPLKITVNPRYQPLQIGVLNLPKESGGSYPIVVVPLGEAGETAPVTEVP